jgi:hypothetical protein
MFILQKIKEIRWQEEMEGEEPRFSHHRPAILSYGSPVRSDPFIVCPTQHQNILPPSPPLIGWVTSGQDAFVSLQPALSWR